MCVTNPPINHFELLIKLIRKNIYIFFKLIYSIASIDIWIVKRKIRVRNFVGFVGDEDACGYVSWKMEDSISQEKDVAGKRVTARSRKDKRDEGFVCLA